MKKNRMYGLMLMLGALAFLFTGCDDDDDWYPDNPWDYGFSWNDPWWYHYHDGSYHWNNDYDHGREDSGQNTILAEAQALNGEWTGTMQYADAQDRRIYKFKCTMSFTQYSQRAVNGTGIEVDVADSATQTLHFKWYVDENNGNINIKYDSGTTFVMDAQANQRGFLLQPGKTFDGYMLGSNTSDMAYIELDRVTADSRSVNKERHSFGSVDLLKPKMNAVTKLVKR